MDLQLSGKSAIICASSSGLGKACAFALAKENVEIWLSGRDPKRLTAAAEDIRAQTSSPVQSVVADITTDAGRDALLAACPNPDILINNAGGPPTGDFRDWDQDQWMSALNANMLTAIDMIRRCLDGMVEREFGRIINITSVAVKLPQAELGLSNGARAGLTGFVAGIARAPSRHNVTINNLLPGFINTERMQNVLATRANEAGIDQTAFNKDFFKSIPAGRPGDPDEFGATCAFLCSQWASYITAQNILVDGGLYPGTL